MAADRAKREAARVDDLMSRIPADVLEALDQGQRERLRGAIAEARPWRRHPIDIRMTVPLFAYRLFLTMVGGADQRAPERRQRDRAVHPFGTTGNLVFIVAAVVLLYAIAGVIAFLVAAAIRG